MSETRPILDQPKILQVVHLPADKIFKITSIPPLNQDQAQKITGDGRLKAKALEVEPDEVPSYAVEQRRLPIPRNARGRVLVNILGSIFEDDESIVVDQLVHESDTPRVRL